MLTVNKPSDNMKGMFPSPVNTDIRIMKCVVKEEKLKGITLKGIY